ncbi:hypothetical protein OKW40_002592 [Paraburkholderia sp. RAU6.4a]
MADESARAGHSGDIDAGAALVWLARAIAGQFMDTALLDLALVPLAGIGLIYIVFFFGGCSTAKVASIRGCFSSRRSCR